MTVHSKPVDESRSKKKANALLLYAAGVTMLGSLMCVLQSNMTLVIKHYGGDPKTASAKAVHLLNRMSSAAAILQFFINPIFGGISDAAGRKFLLLAAPLATVIFRISVALNQSISNVIIARMITGALIPAYFTSVNAATGDMFKGDAESLAEVQGKLQVVHGLGLIVGPLVGGYLTKIDVRYPYYFASVLGILSLVFLSFFKETLREEDKKPVHFKAVNPLAFLKLFTISPTFAKFSLVYALQTIPLFVGNVPQIYARTQRNWGPEQIGKHQSFEGLSKVLSGLFTPVSVNIFGTQYHTMISNVCAGAAQYIWARTVSTFGAYFGILFFAPGEMRRNATVARITALANETNMGQGEFQARRSNLVALLKSIAPMVYASLYTRGVELGFPGLPFLGSVCCFAAAEMMMLTIRSSEWTPKLKKMI